MLSDNNSLSFVQDLLGQGIRLDGREAFQGRLISMDFMDNHGNKCVIQDAYFIHKAKHKL